MDRIIRMTKVPPGQLLGLAKAIERIGGEKAEGKGADILAQTGEEKPTYGDVVDLAGDAGTFDLALRKAGANLAAGKVGRVLQLLRAFGPGVPVCGSCGDLAADLVGGEALVRSAGQACPGCGAFLEDPGAARPYAAWTTGREVAPTISFDFDTVPGDQIPLTEKEIRMEYTVDAGLDALLASEGVPLTRFLLWLYHGQEKTRFARAPRRALAFLADPLAETHNQNVARNWVRAAKGYAVAEPAVPGGEAANITGQDGLTPERQLADLLDDLFNAGEFRRFVTGHMNWLEVAKTLPDGPVPMSELTRSAASAWSHHGLLAEVFPALRTERPRRQTDIDKVARRFGQ